MESVTEISGNLFSGGKTLFPLAERNFLSSESCFLLFRASFLEVKSVTQTQMKQVVCIFYKMAFLISKLKTIPILSFKNNCQGANLFYIFSADGYNFTLKTTLTVSSSKVQN